MSILDRINCKLIAEAFRVQPYKRIDENPVTTRYEFEVGGRDYAAFVAGNKGSGMYDVDFGMKTSEDDFTDDGYNFIDLAGGTGSEATDVVETVIDIVRNHYASLDERERQETQYMVSPMIEGGKKENRRFSLYLRQASRAIKKGLPVNVDINTYGGQEGITFTITPKDAGVERRFGNVKTD